MYKKNRRYKRVESTTARSPYFASAEIQTKSFPTHFLWLR